METAEYFQRYKGAILRNTFANSLPQLPATFRIHQDPILSVFYAPFDYINRGAKIVICGITPGLQQAVIAFRVAREQLQSGQSDAVALKQAKQAASFGGSMRTNLVNMLDHIGLSRKLGLRTASELFLDDCPIAHFTSALRYPVFLRRETDKGIENYNGSPNMIKSTVLRQQIVSHLREEVERISQSAVYVSLGPKPAEALHYLAGQGILNDSQILDGLPHPSAANAERIAYFLGRKSAKLLSSKTDPAKLDRERTLLLQKVKKLRI